MHRQWLLTGAVAFSLAAAAASSDVVEIAPGDVEIVVVPGATPTTRFAAEELQSLLGELLGDRIPVVDGAGSGKAQIVLENAPLERDEFRIRADAAARRVTISGRDSKDDVGKLVREGRFSTMRREKATLFGVYELLERFAGARFYFPGDVGTILPRASRVSVPAGEIRVKPAFSMRSIYFNGDGAWTDGSGAVREGVSQAKALNWCRLRLETFNVPCCHGQTQLQYQERFAKTHPEYFCLLPDHRLKTLRRDTDPKHPLEYHPSQLCHTSGVWDEFYLDIKARLSGEKASTRGLSKWGSNFRERYVDIMPMDGMPRCRCEKCQAAYARYPVDERDFATDLIWGNVAKLVNRLNAEGFDATYTMMSYGPYGRIPDFDLPSNILVKVATPGPWFGKFAKLQEEQFDKIRAWYGKTGSKVSIWTYPGKYARYQAPCVVQMTPRAYGRYFTRMAPFIVGAFCESESDRAIYNYLNYYVFARIAWNPDTDVDALISEHHRLMFGAAAPMMAEFYDALERKWMDGFLRTPDKVSYENVENRIPNVLELATSVYSPSVLAGWDSLFDRAEAAVADDADCLRRVKFMRAQLLEPTKRHFSGYIASLDVGKALEMRRRPSAPNIVDDSMFVGRVRGVVSRDAANFVTAPDSIRVDASPASKEGYAMLRFRDHGIKLKPNTKYRISYFLKYKDIKPVHTDGGVSVSVDSKLRYGWMEPTMPFCGSHDWMYQSFVMDTGNRTRDTSALYLFVNGATGTAWFDDVRVEEVAGKGDAL